MNLPTRAWINLRDALASAPPILTRMGKVLIMAIFAAYLLLVAMFVSGLRILEVLCIVLLHSLWIPSRDPSRSLWETATTYHEQLAPNSQLKFASPFGLTHIIAFAILPMIVVLACKATRMKPVPYGMWFAGIVLALAVLRDAAFHVDWWELVSIYSATALVSFYSLSWLRVPTEDKEQACSSF